MKVYRKGVTPPPPDRFAASVGETQAIVEEPLLVRIPALRRGLEAFGRALADQLAAHARASGRRDVLGVTIHGINFSIILDPEMPS